MFSGTITGGIVWDKLTSERMQEKKALEPYGYKVYSQNDEDGILHEIFKRIGVTNKIFVEFGVQDGLESNTHLLLFYGWKGLWIEGSEEYCNIISEKFKTVIKNHKLIVSNEFIDTNNINNIIKKAGLNGEIDLLSIDIDGNDWHVWKAINEISPRVVVVEYNGKFPPDLEWVQAYNKSHIWDGSDWHGASLKSFEKLGREKGYQLVGTNIKGCNAFFVKSDIAKNLFLKPATSENLYNPLRMDVEFVSNYPAKFCLVDQVEGLGILNYRQVALVEGFYTEENTDYVWSSQKECKLHFAIPKGKYRIEVPIYVPEALFINEIYEIEYFIKKEKYLKRIIKSTDTLTFLIENNKNEMCILELEIHVPKIFIPAEIIKDSKDYRQLGIAIGNSRIIDV